MLFLFLPVIFRIMSHIFFAGVLELSLETYCCQDVLLAVFIVLRAFALTESEKISLVLGQYGTDFLGLLAVSNRSRFLNFGLGPKEIQFSRALVNSIT